MFQRCFEVSVDEGRIVSIKETAWVEENECWFFTGLDGEHSMGATVHATSIASAAEFAAEMWDSSMTREAGQ